MPSPTPDDDMTMLEKHANELAEHFDSVQIFVTRHEGGEKNGTVNASQGAGNWFARYGQVKSWVIKQDECAREEVRGQNDD